MRSGGSSPISWGLGTEIQKRAGQKRSWQICGAEQGTGRAGFAFSRTREIPEHRHSRNEDHIGDPKLGIQGESDTGGRDKWDFQDLGLDKMNQTMYMYR